MMKQLLPIVVLAGLTGVGLTGAGVTAAAQNTPAAQDPAQQQVNPQSSQPSVSAQPTAAQPGSGQGSGALRIAPGSVLPVQLTKSIDAKKLKVGETVEARITQDLKAANGQGMVAKDTKVIGHVTEAQARSKEQKESQVGIAFDHIVMKNGAQFALPMSIQAIIGSSNSNSSSGGAEDVGPGAMPGAGGMSTGGAGGRPGMGGGTQPPVSIPTTGQPQQNRNTQPRITGETQGVVGISNLELTTTAADSAQGSVVKSEKNNVKLESGTMLLLRSTSSEWLGWVPSTIARNSKNALLWYVRGNSKKPGL